MSHPLPRHFHLDPLLSPGSPDLSALAESSRSMPLTVFRLVDGSASSEPWYWTMLPVLSVPLSRGIEATAHSSNVVVGSPGKAA